MRPGSDFAQRTFFDSIARNLHEKGVLKTYETPLGEPRLDWEKRTKVAHYDTPSKDTPGIVTHIGDEPYGHLTTAQLHYWHDIDNFRPEELMLKATSIRAAIKEYMPEQDFLQYVRFFSENLELPSHKEALKKAMQNIAHQMQIKSKPISAQELETRIQNDSPEDIRTNLHKSEVSYEAAKQPELVLAMAIYQAAQIGYLEQLRSAIVRSPAISDDEKENANAVFDGPFIQFKHSMMFETLLPLILFERSKITPQGTDEQSQIEVTKQAIHKGWATFFDKKLLQREYPESEIPPHPNGKPAIMVCPANKHLRSAMESNVIENIFSAVVAHKEQLSKPLGMVEDALAEAGLIKDKREKGRG